MSSGSKKRSKPSNNTPSLDAAKKKKAATVMSILQSPDLANEETSSPVPFADSESSPVKQYCFKNPNFVHSAKGSGKRGPGIRSWKTLKQIMAMERSFQRKPDEELTYESLDAPPSFIPAKKYSDLSGLSAKYTDPQTKLRYYDADEFSRIKMLPSDIVAGYLALRKASAAVP